MKEERSIKVLKDYEDINYTLVKDNTQGVKKPYLAVYKMDKLKMKWKKEDADAFTTKAEAERRIQRANSWHLYAKISRTFDKHNADYNITSQYDDPDNRLYGAVVIANGPYWKKEYPLDSRTYIFSSDNKEFIGNMLGSSVFAYSKDKSDQGVRLDYYLRDKDNPWIIEDSYFCDADGNRIDLDSLENQAIKEKGKEL